MKTAGRPGSTNIEDRTDPVVQQNLNNEQFVKQSYDAAATWKGTMPYNHFVKPGSQKGNTNGSSSN